MVLAKQFTLAHPTLPWFYDFIPCGSEVYVVHHKGARKDRYTIPLEEARQLWASLLTKGYERF